MCEQVAHAEERPEPNSHSGKRVGSPLFPVDDADRRVHDETRPKPLTGTDGRPKYARGMSAASDCATARLEAANAVRFSVPCPPEHQATLRTVMHRSWRIVADLNEAKFRSLALELRVSRRRDRARALRDRDRRRHLPYPQEY